MVLNLILILLINDHLWHEIAASCSCGARTDYQNEQTCPNRRFEIANEVDHELNKEIDSRFLDDMVVIPEGSFLMGTDEPVFLEDREHPKRSAYVHKFLMDKHEVSNRKFAEFVRESNYRTDAQRFGNSFVFEQLISEQNLHHLENYRVLETPWWISVNGAHWKKPFFNATTYKRLLEHPVVHVSWNDAKTYCEFYGKRLPTESEWEYACRGGLEQKLFPWGNEDDDIHYRANIWHGDFPVRNDMLGTDIYLGTAPVDSFEPNAFGLHNIVGNVWEWTADHWTNQTAGHDMIKKGGSFLCAKNYCYRYRCAARSASSKDTSTSNIGFRCAADYSFL